MTPFAPLHAAISRTNAEGGFSSEDPWFHELRVDDSDGSIDVEYRGEYELWFRDRTKLPILEQLLRALASREIAPALRSFTYRTDAVKAANGTYDYNIDALVYGDHTFPNLTRVSLDQGEGEHGYKILSSPAVGDDWSEAGALARLLQRAPRLDELATPAQPNLSFFNGPDHPLRRLDVDAGFDRARFIDQLAASSRFGQLRSLVFTDFRQSYLDDWRERTTSFASYAAFFASPLASQLDSICLRAVQLSEDEVRQLRAIRSDGVEITR
ncbi:MAG TPA: hypothetical protein VGG28_09960 [Kofleriaceae bacterium]|jgi:hypothetical protein